MINTSNCACYNACIVTGLHVNEINQLEWYQALTVTCMDELVELHCILESAPNLSLKPDFLALYNSMLCDMATGKIIRYVI